MATIRLNIGSGGDYRSGWVNIDAVAACQPDIVQDIRNKLPFADSSVDEILAQDILEHLTAQELPKVLEEMSRVLKPGGQVTARVPNPDAIIGEFADDREVRNQFLYGNTAETGVFGAHKQGFTEITLTAAFLSQGLELLSLEQITTNFVAQFRKQPRSVGQIKKLVLIVHTHSLGGAEVFLGDLLQALQVQGISSSVYTTGKQAAELFKKLNLPVSRLNHHLDVIGDWKGLLKSILLLPFSTLETMRVLKKENSSDIILLSGFSEKILVSPIAYFFHMPVVWIEFGPLHTVFSKFFFLPKFLYRLVKEIPEKVIVPTKHTLDLLIPQTRLSLARLTQIPCGRRIDKKYLKTNKKKKKSSALRIICVSRLESGKGQDILIQAMPSVLAAFPSARLDIVGVGMFQFELEQLVKTLQLEQSVRFVGFVPDALAEIQAANVLVFPSIWELEGFGLTITEAMALGTPVIAFKSGPVPELITHETGVLVEERTPEALASALISLLSDSERAAQLARRAQRRFLERFQISMIAEQYTKVFSEVLVRKASKVLLQIRDGSNTQR